MEALDSLPTTGPVAGAPAATGGAAPAGKGFHQTLRHVREEGGAAAATPVGAGPRTAAGAAAPAVPAQGVSGQIAEGQAAGTQVVVAQGGTGQALPGQALPPGGMVGGQVTPLEAAGQGGRPGETAITSPSPVPAVPQNAGQVAAGNPAKPAAGETPPPPPTGSPPIGRAAQHGKGAPSGQGVSARVDAKEDAGPSAGAEAGEFASAENAPALPWPAMPTGAGAETGVSGLTPPNMAGEAGVLPQEPPAAAILALAGAPIAGQAPPPASPAANPAAALTGTARAIGTGRPTNGAANRAAGGPSSPAPGPAGSAAAGEAGTGGIVAEAAEGARKASAPSEKQAWAEHPARRADGADLPGSSVTERPPGSAPSGFEALLGEGGKASEAGPARAGSEVTAASLVPATASSALPVGIMSAHSPPPVALPVSAPPPEAGAVPRLMPRVAPAEQVAPVAIALALGGGTDGRISLSLDPVELGRVEVTVERLGEGARVQVAAERPETLALLARDGASLDRALGGAGIGGDGGRSISFSLLGGDAGGQGNASGNGQGGGRQGGQWHGIAGEPPEASNTQHRALLGLLDIAI